ncbi:unnamed protein product [Heligmosomoides polygyrus]|uniref:G protein-coupled receptor n=1 Tax=Heligmosomoides polygyrus TaxID=6339 RepID=A0A3P8BUZ0_HELPZ|nr:unnamed protein product [Heligmosomoides polygyrus]
MFTLSTLATLGIYWAGQINKTLKESSISTQTKCMQRRMNQLLMMQTACPLVFLHTPAMISYLLMYTGATSNDFVMYCSGALFMMFPIFSPMITIGFLKEYRSFFLRKIGLQKEASLDTTSGVSDVHPDGYRKLRPAVKLITCLLFDHASGGCQFNQSPLP